MPSPQSLLSRLWRVAVEDVEPVISRQAFAHLAEHLPNSAFFRTRTAMLRAAGVQIGEHSLIQGKIRLTGHGNPCKLLSIGDETLVTGGLHIDLGARVRIGNLVSIGHDVSLLTISHAVGPWDFRAGPSFSGEIVIGDGCWLASRCTVLPGVTIGAGSIVAAGSMVTRDVPKHTLVAGVPARPIRELPGASEDTPRTANRHVATPPAAAR